MLNMRVVLCSLLAMCAASVHASSWSRAYRGATDPIRDVARAADGSLWFATQHIHGDHLVHVSPTGAIVGARALPRDYQFGGIWAVSDGVLIAGNVRRNGDEWVAHIDRSFAVRWSARFDAPNRFFLNEGVLLRDGSAVFGGQLRAAPFAIRFSPRGEIVWQKTYDASTEDDFFQCITAARDGGFYAGGTSSARGWLVKFRADGTIEWQRLNMRGSGIFAIRETATGEVITATSAYIDNEAKAMIEKITPSGDAAWSMAARSDGASFGRDVALLPDGGFLLAGYTKSHDVYAARLNAQGRASSQMLIALGRTRQIHVAGTNDVVAVDTIGESPDMLSVLIGVDPSDPPSSCVGGKRVDWKFEPFEYSPAQRNVEVENTELTAVAEPVVLQEAKLTEEACTRAAAPAQEQMAQAPETLLARYRALRAERTALIDEIKKLYLARQFDELGKRAASWRANREHNGPHYTKLEILYDTLGLDLARGNVPLSQLLAIADEWHAHDPQSPSPWIVRAYLLYREVSLANETAQEKEKVQAFAAAVREAERNAASDPFTYVLLIWLADHSGEGDILEIARRSAQAGPPLARVFIEGAGALRTSERHIAFLDEAARLTRARSTAKVSTPTSAAITSARISVRRPHSNRRRSCSARSVSTGAACIRAIAT